MTDDTRTSISFDELTDEERETLIQALDELEVELDRNIDVKNARKLALEEAAGLAKDGTKCGTCGRVQIGWIPPEDCEDWAARRKKNDEDHYLFREPYIKPYNCNFDILNNEELAEAILNLIEG